jgi:hypothetical protein
VELKEKIEAWIAEKKAARTRPVGEEMDTN